MELSRVDAAIDHAVSEIAKTDAAIEQVREDYLALVVSSPQDQAGYQSAETALKKMVRIRTSVEKTRKALKADSVRYGKAVDGEAKRIREAIEPIEEHLKTQCDIVRLEEARQKVAAENARRDEVNGWVAELSDIGWPVDLPALQRMTAEEFGFTLLSAKRAYSERESERVELAELRAEKAKREANQKSADVMWDVTSEQLQMFAQELRAEKAKRESNQKSADVMWDVTSEQLQMFAHRVADMDIPVTLEAYKLDIRGILEEAADKIGDLI